MDCAGCGSCCTDQTIKLTILERNTIPAEEMTRNRQELLKVNGHCIRFDPITRRCKNHEERPQICRDFKAGCGRCVLMRAYAHRNLDGIGEHAIPLPVKPGSYAAFVRLMTLEEDPAGNVLKITHPSPDYPTQIALANANAELPSQGF